MPPRRAAATFDALVPTVVLCDARPPHFYAGRTHGHARGSFLASSSTISLRPFSSPVPRIHPSRLPLAPLFPFPRPKDDTVILRRGGGGKCDSVFRQRSAVSAGTYRWCAIESCRVSASVLRWSALWKGHRRKDRLAESRWVARFHQHAFASTLLPCLLWTTCATGVVARGWPLPCEITGVKLSMINSRCEIQSVEKSVLKSEWDLLILELELKNGLKKNRFKSRGSWSLSKVKDVWCAFCRLLLFLVFLEGREGEGN